MDAPAGTEDDDDDMLVVVVTVVVTVVVAVVAVVDLVVVAVVALVGVIDATHSRPNVAVPTLIMSAGQAGTHTPLRLKAEFLQRKHLPTLPSVKSQVWQLLGPQEHVEFVTDVDFPVHL